MKAGRRRGRQFKWLTTEVVESEACCRGFGEQAVAERVWEGAQAQLRVGVEAAPRLAVGQDAASAEAEQVESGEVVVGAPSAVPLRRALDRRQACRDRPGTCQSRNAAQGGPGVVSVSSGDAAPEVAGRPEVGHPEPGHVRCHAVSATDQADPRTNPPPTAILRSPDVSGTTTRSA